MRAVNPPPKRRGPRPATPASRRLVSSQHKPKMWQPTHSCSTHFAGSSRTSPHRWPKCGVDNRSYRGLPRLRGSMMWQNSLSVVPDSCLYSRRLGKQGNRNRGRMCFTCQAMLARSTNRSRTEKPGWFGCIGNPAWPTASKIHSNLQMSFAYLLIRTNVRHARA